VLVDAPCSGSGTLRRHPDLKWRQSDASLAALAASQRSILAAAARLVKPGGRLVYATCSVLASEGEDVADDFERTNAAFARVPAADALRRARVADAASLVGGERLRLWTHRHATDGFFAALWRRS
jgi:16S rRNA (cytosine967-C5)-methyltransferase